ncbi:MAG TPA: hypothetical protein VN804_02475 [Solirubrobacteraceae bacterium]|nr:hypothetical protein [Solirubrobacteraceae bacterium]
MSVFERAELRLAKLPRCFEPGEDAPAGWAILAETWLCTDGRTIGVHPHLTRVEDGWLVSYETVPETTVEKLLDPDPWDCWECRTVAEPGAAGWLSDYSSTPVARFCPDCVEHWSIRRKHTPGALV